MCPSASFLPEWLVAGIALELSGLILLILDTILRVRNTDRASRDATAMPDPIKVNIELTDPIAITDEAPRTTTYGDLMRVMSDMDALDRRLRELIDQRFDRALADSRKQAEDIREELRRDLRRTAWRPIVGTTAAMLGLLASSIANVCAL